MSKHRNTIKRDWKTKEKQSENSEKTEAKQEIEEGQASELFTKRLQKSKLKELENKLREAQGGENASSDMGYIKSKILETRKAVFTDERKLEQRKQGFDRASSKRNSKKQAMDEFM